jgi:hypothetical protein
MWKVAFPWGCPVKPSERDLQRAVETLRGDHEPAGELDDVRVEWRDAAPNERPDGMTWQPPSGDEPGRLAYDVWDAQRETLDAVDSGALDIVAFLAGYGSGKSVFGARWLLTQALEYPGSKFLAMGQDFKKARDTTFTKLFAQLPGERTTLTTSGFNGPENSPVVADYNRQQHRVTLVNDSVIVLGSADKYSRYAGAEFGGAWLDEPSHYGDVLHDLTGMITTRLRGVDGPKVQLWTLTGEGYNAAWEILEQRQGADGESIGLDVDVVRASVLDNPYLADGDKARFRRKYEGTDKEEQALHGGFAAASGLVYDAFRRDVHVRPNDDVAGRVDEEWRVYGYDAGWNDPRVLLEIGKTGYGQLVVLDEFCQSGAHVSGAIAWLDQTDKPMGTIYCEHEPADVEKFKTAGYRAEKAVKSLDAGIAEVRKRLQHDGAGEIDETAARSRVTRLNGHDDELSDHDGWEKVGLARYRRSRGSGSTSDGDEGDADPDGVAGEGAGRVGLLVSERCEQTVREFLGYKEEHVGTSQAVDHCLDSLRYAVMGVAGVKRSSAGGGA